jgi:transketolase
MTMKPMAMRDALLARIWQTMESDRSLFFVSADFGSPVLDRIRADFPDRFINVGVAEQNLINVSAGLSLEGFTVFAYAIAPFITMRCYEQLRVNLALLSRVRQMNVNLIGVGAGYSYVVSGPTHQCYEDLTVIRALPSFEVLSPADHVTAAALLDRCLQRVGPKYLRFDAQVLPVVYVDDSRPPPLDQGFAHHRKGAQVTLVATGFMLHTAFRVADRLAEAGIMVGVIDVFDITGFDRHAMESALRDQAGIVTMEEGFRGRGGIDALFREFAAETMPWLRQAAIGVEGGYRFELGTRAELHEQVGIGEAAVARTVAEFVRSLS